MDPFMHLILPLMFLMALRVDPRKAILFAPLAILPDFDAAFGLHRSLGHSFIPILVLPLIVLSYSKLKRPEWMMSALVVQFYLASHIILDLAGVAFLWPLVDKQLFVDATIRFNLQGGVNFIFDFDWGWRNMPPMGTTDFLSESGVAIIFLGILMAVVFRKEARKALLDVLGIVRGILTSLRA